MHKTESVSAWVTHDRRQWVRTRNSKTSPHLVVLCASAFSITVTVVVCQWLSCCCRRRCLPQGWEIIIPPSPYVSITYRLSDNECRLPYRYLLRQVLAATSSHRSALMRTDWRSNRQPERDRQTDGHLTASAST